MLKIESDTKKGKILVQMEGKSDEIIAEVISAINKIYHGINDKDKKTAELFKSFLTECANNGDLWATEKEIDKKVKDIDDKMLEKLDKVLDKMIEALLNDKKD